MKAIPFLALFLFVHTTDSVQTPSPPIVVLANAAPVITLEPNPDTLLSPALLEAHPQVSDPDGTIDSVSYFFRTNGAAIYTLLATIQTDPFALSLADFISPGGTLMAVARDNLGATNSVTVPVNMFGLEGDDYRRPYLLTGPYATHSTNNNFATYQGTGEPSLSRSPKSLFYRWIAPAAGRVIISTEGSTFDTDLEISIPPSQPLPSMVNDDFFGKGAASLVKFYAREATTYLIRVGSTLTNVGTVHLTINQRPPSTLAAPAPANDNFSQRIHIPDAEFDIPATTRGATAEPGEPVTPPGPWGPTNSVWFSWEAPRDGLVTLSTDGTFDTRLGVFTNLTSFATFRLRGANDDWSGFNSFLQFSAQAGALYAICLDGIAGSQGEAMLSLRYDSADAPTNDIFADRTILSGEQTTGASRLNGATNEPGEPALVAFMPQQSKTLWWSWTAPRSGRTYVSGKIIQPNGIVLQPEVAVYTGTEVSALTQVARGLAFFNPPKKIYAYFDAEAGQTYALQLASIAVAARADIGVTMEPLAAPAAPSFISITINNESIDFTVQPVEGLSFESSPNLVDWDPVTPTFTQPNRFQLPYSAAPAQFYRAVVE